MARKINFLVVGAQKSGTTMLYEALRRHPDIFLPLAKEITFFSNAHNFAKGRAYLEQYYDESAILSGHLIGAFDIQALYFPGAAERIFRYNPEMKIIAILRNPIERALSAFEFAKLLGREAKDLTFEEVISRNARYTQFDELELFTYLEHGLYYAQLLRFYNYFPSEQIKICFMDDLASQPETLIDDIFQFIGVSPPREYGIDLHKPVNQGGQARIPWLQSLIVNKDSFPKRVLKFIVPKPLHKYLQELVYHHVFYWNVKRKKTLLSTLDPKTLHYLKRYYRDDVAKLSELTGRNLIEMWNIT